MIVKMAGGWLEEEQERITGRGGVMIVRRRSWRLWRSESMAERRRLMTQDMERGSHDVKLQPV
jgi:hypothetical protein